MKRAAAILVPLAAVAGLAWWATASYSAAVQRATRAEAAATALREQLKNAKAATVTVTQYVDRERVIRLKGDTIIKEVPRYVPVQADTACVVPRGFVRLNGLMIQPWHPFTTGSVQPIVPGQAVMVPVEVFRPAPSSPKATSCA
ncbi:Uncharacterised protein [Ralstonia mannitolilytica]|uniref:hypothetical protein n=1 Tax=Ralstonia mannitolilytica TaxID=105219 RepID=UPI000DF88374|nr:hypothetical protein [Ralstonia mannitolilytica]SUD93276.1 Uncharacterised protein [Ralstonia mannitolilytica]